MSSVHALAPRCPACGEPLRELGSVGSNARGCDACGGFWLDNSAQSQVAPVIQDQKWTPPAPALRCPWCAAELRPVLVATPSAIWLDHCAAHGIWFDACDLPALKQPRLCAQIARATLGQNPRTDPAERAALAAAVDATESRAGYFGFVRPKGNPATVGLGPGNQPFMGGVFIASRGRPHHALVKPMSAWIGPLILLVVGGPIELVLAWRMLTGPTPMLISVAVLALVFLVLAAFAAGAYLWASHARKKYLVLDADSRGIQEIEGRRLVLWVPRQLMRRVHVQVYTAHRMGTVYDILISVGFAELWIHQAVNDRRARELAQTVAQCLDLPLDPEIHPKPR